MRLMEIKTVLDTHVFINQTTHTQIFFSLLPLLHAHAQMGLKIFVFDDKKREQGKLKVFFLWQRPSELALRETCEGDRETHP